MTRVASWVTKVMAGPPGPPPPPRGWGRAALPPRPCLGPARRAFTLVELLTVIAIIAVLATLLLTALTAAQKKSRQARCTANLHQLSLALNMYMDDFSQRARRLDPLAQTKYLPNRDVLICPQDRTAMWGNLVSGDPLALAQLQMGGSRAGDSGPAMPPTHTAAEDEPLHSSYLHPLPWDDAAWEKLMKAGSLAGVAACQLHGLGKADPVMPSIYDFEGLVLRAQRDGAVVRRKVFWTGGAQNLVLGPSTSDSGESTPASTASMLVPFVLPPWPLFVDDPPQ